MGNSSTNGQQVARPRGLPLPRTRWGLVGFVFGVVTWAIVGGEPNVPKVVGAKEPGEAVDSPVMRAALQVRDGVQDASATVRERFADVRSSGRRHSLASAVENRLAQDEAIDAERVEVQCQDSGTVLLKGMVADEDAKEHAVEVARETPGVDRVEDHLAIPPAPRVFEDPVVEQAAAPRARRVR